MTRAFALLGALFALVLAGATGFGLGLWLAAHSWVDDSDTPAYRFDETDEAAA